MTPMNTDELLSHIRADEGKLVEARLSLAGGLACSTHRIMWWNHRVEDQGCDDLIHRTSMKQFRMAYPPAAGKIWSVET